MLVPIPGQLAPMAPAPLPTGLTFEGSQQGHSDGHKGGEHQHGAQEHGQYETQLGQNAGEGNQEGEEDYYSFDYPPVSKYIPFCFTYDVFRYLLCFISLVVLPPFVVVPICGSFLLY